MELAHISMMLSAEILPEIYLTHLEDNRLLHTYCRRFSLHVDLLSLILHYVVVTQGTYYTIFVIHVRLKRNSTDYLLNFLFHIICNSFSITREPTTERPTERPTPNPTTQRPNPTYQCGISGRSLIISLEL